MPAAAIHRFYNNEKRRARRDAGTVSVNIFHFFPLVILTALKLLGLGIIIHNGGVLRLILLTHFVVLQLPGKVLVVRTEVDQSVTAIVKQNNFLLAFLFGFFGFIHHSGQRMVGFRGGNRPFGFGKQTPASNAASWPTALASRIPSSISWLTVGAMPWYRNPPA